MKILIPTCRWPHELAGMMSAIHATTDDSAVIVSGLPASAAINRNYCLTMVAVGEVAIMIDDDVDGFYPGWIDDLLAAMRDESVVMASARLLRSDGSFGPTCSRCLDESPDEIEITSNGVCVLPTAAIGFRNRGFTFDEHFLGSGWEDNDWCQQYLAADPSAKFIQSNRCRLVHRNEMKHQHGENWRHNQAYFFQKWHGRKAAKCPSVNLL